MSHIDPRTPVLIGVGQIIDRLGEDGYEALSAVDLAARAAARAIDDAGGDPRSISERIDTVAGIRQFEITTPGAPVPLGRSNNFPRSVAGRIAARPARAILEVGGGQGPQHLITELAGDIAAGRSQVALAFGSEAISTTRALAAAPEKPDFGETIEGDLEDRGFGLKGLVSMEAANHGLVDAPSQYALLENARRARLGLSRAEYDAEIGRLFAPFTRVAAQNPFAAAPVERSAEELVTPTEANRPIADPYLRYVVSRDQVNQGAAVLIASVEAARELGVPEDRWVFVHGHADARERDLLDRADLSASPAARLAAGLALEMAGVAPDEVATWDFYSCFPVPVFNAAVDGLGLSPDDPRGLTLTGGLPFFGGAGNNYSMHAVAETVQRARRRPGSFGFVGANGGVMSKYSTAVYSTTPREWQADRSASIQAQIDTVEAVPQVSRARGWATIETYTVKHDRAGRKTGIVIGRLEKTGERFVAMGLEGDDEIVALLESEQPIGRRVWALSTGPGNRVTTSPERADAVRPPRAPALRDAYEHVRVERDGHLLIVTIDRPEARNALFPPAHEELSDVFDAFFADGDLWVAIITGAGEQAFCAGNDLVYSASGKPNYLPESGFAGLTSRRGMNKPVIAAVNGFAMGGGFETALAAHLVVADETAQFALSEVKVGLVAGAGGVVRLPRAIPEKVANELILTGRRIGAEEARQLGVVSRIAPAGGALEAAQALAAEILDGSPTSVRISLEVMNETRGIPDVVDAVTARTSAFDDLMSSFDAIEGITAFATKRRPQWKNQ
ncbi:acetyl-CoA acetyltransferase [Microbacterium sp. No. 7]|uniref:acetyl-CoA acetyltransferase n=1 Tax=Microbacterium sp. No. 7 TaxID=1714373 RepID=UPI0006CFE4EA|nr:acetyl-CoA acetyltransferase [Microbacterium sp. No. 7]ALJ21723.1 acetyl-CoA acetyltransferase [Microbacterium sp. No. 7]